MDESYSININSSDPLLNSTHIDKSISDLSKLEREINQLQSHNTQPYSNIKDELLNSIIEDQREQIIFLKDEIRFLRDECKANRKYIRMLGKMRITNTCNETNERVDERESNFSSLINDTRRKHNASSDTTSEISIDKLKHVTVRKSKSVKVQMNNVIVSHLDKQQLKDVRAEKHQTYK